jgi:hypothetical protein
MQRPGVKPRILPLICVIMALTVVACDREGGSIWDEVRTPQAGATSSPTERSGTKTPATARPGAVPTHDVSEEDLEAMVLTLAEYGSEYEDFELQSENSGPQSRAERIDSACDPEDEASDLDRTGWVSGYDRPYTMPSVGFSFSGPEEGVTFLVGSSIDVFQVADGAADRFEDEVSESLDEAHSECQDLILGQVEEFSVPAIGDEAWGASVSFSESVTGSDIEGVMTAVYFRLGRIVACVAVIRIGDEGAPAEAVRLAQRLDEKITARLRGEVPAAESPVPSLHQGAEAEVFGTVTCLNVRKAPSKSAEIVKCLVDGTEVYIEGGPVDADGYRWWRLRDLGWAAENWLRPLSD